MSRVKLYQPIKERLDRRIEQLRPQLHPKSEMNEWIGVVANLWDTISMIGVLITGVVILLFFRDDTAGILDVVILAVCAMVVITIVISMFVIRSWKTSRHVLVESISRLPPGPWVIMDVLLRLPYRNWDRREIYDECKRHMYPTNPTNTEYLQLMNEGMVILSGEHVRLHDRYRRESDFLTSQMHASDTKGT